MPTTSRFGLRFPAATDPDNPPQDFGFLAGDVDGWLARWFPCTSSTRPAGLTGDDTGFGIFETDTQNCYVWNGTAWAVPSNFAAAGGGGGGGSASIATVAAAWQASSAQSIASGSDVTVGFSTAIGTADPAITRAPSGAGHEFTLTQTRSWIITTTIRYAQDNSGGRLVTLQTGTGAVLAKASAPVNTDAPWSTSLAVARRLPAGTTVKVVTRHNSLNGAVLLEHEGGPSVQISFVGV